MNIKQIKNTLREFQAKNRQKFKNTQAEFKKAVSFIKQKCTYLPTDQGTHPLIESLSQRLKSKVLQTDG